MATKTVLLTSGTTWTVPADLDTSQDVVVTVIGGGGGNAYGATLAAAATAWLAVVYPDKTYVSHTVTGPTSLYVTHNTGNSASQTFAKPVCPAGYEVGTASCTLVDATDVIKGPDGQCEFVKVGGVFNSSALDHDCASSVIVGDGTSTLQVSYSGLEAVTVAHVSTGAGTAVTYQSYNSGTNQTTSVTTQLDATHNVTGQSSGTLTGNSVGGGTGGGSGSGEGGGSCGGPSQPACAIDESGTPTESSAGADGIAALNAVTPATLGLLAYEAGSGFLAWTGLPTLTGSDSCTPPTAFANVTIGGVTVPFDPCTVWLPFKQWLAWLLWASLVVFVYLRTTRALSGG